MFIKTIGRNGAQEFNGEQLSLNYEINDETVAHPIISPKINRSNSLVVVYSNSILAESFGEIVIYSADKDHNDIILPKNPSATLYIYQNEEVIGIFTRDKGNCVFWRYKE